MSATHIDIERSGTKSRVPSRDRGVECRYQATLLRAGLAFAALGLALHACTPQVALAAPPAGSEWNSPVARWFRSLQNAEGHGCCSEADCRNTAVRPTDSGGLEAWIGKEQFGDDAPDAWMPVPAEEIKARGDRPPSVRGAIVCFYLKRVYCADIEDGT